MFISSEFHIKSVNNMKTIWKFDVPIEGIFEIEMPINAKILHVGVQSGKPEIWAQVDTAEKRDKRHFVMFGTGHEMDKVVENLDLQYLGSFLIAEDTLVFHLFEAVDAK